ncbi:MAG: aminotransferase class V-fold PLP-dependent enzyme, partial [Clostridia bacterium]|nr:aminotransferase class V-fold PLP-dependent enzyme [Clostridia bacterium]
MVYFDNAATTWPKPKSVLSAVERAMREYGANPGRGGYDMASDTDAQVYGCRKRAADMFGAKSPEKVIFTPGCTYSINYVLRGVLRPGDHVIISNLEHNAVIRPLHYLHRCGVSVTRVDICEGDHDTTLRRFRSAIRRNTAMIFCTHASNVFGVQIPINSIGELCRREGILFGVDAAQSAGSIAIDVGANHIDYLCLPAHKGLYGIMGLGMLIIGEDAPLPSPLIMGGTGSLSAIREQPEELPDRLESGTLNVPAICALRAGMDMICGMGESTVMRHEMDIIASLYRELAAIKG